MRLKALNWQKISWVIAVETALVLFVLTFFLPGGDDLFRYFCPFANGCLECGFVPYFAQWLLAPVAWIPKTVVWPVWTAVSLGILLFLCKKTRANPASFMLSFPLLGQVWLGQIDVLVCIGLVVVMYSDNPYLRGVGFALLAIKPQVAGIIILLCLLDENRRDLLKVLAAPLLVLFTSLAQFGWNWPVNWLDNSLSGIPAHVWRLAAEDLWPFALVLLPLPFFFKGKDKIRAGLLVSSLAVPVYGVYSYIVFLLLGGPKWALPLGYIWVIAIPFLGNEAIRFAWLLPATLLGQMVYLRFFTPESNMEPFQPKP